MRRPNLLGLGLLAASCYATIRYWFYSMVLKVSPIRARRRLKRGQPAIEQPGVQLVNDLHQQIALEVHKYFPSIGKKAVAFKFTDRADPLIDDIKIPLGVRVLTALESLDYIAPVLVNVTAMLTYLGAFRWAYSLLRRIILG